MYTGRHFLLGTIQGGMNNVLREIYDKVDARTKARMRAATKAVHDRAAPKTPFTSVKSKVRKLLTRAEVVHAALNPPPASLDRVLAALRHMMATLRRPRPSFSALLRNDHIYDAGLVVFTEASPPDTRSDSQYVLSFVRAVQAFLTRLLRDHRVSNARLSRAAVEDRKKRKLRQRVDLRPAVIEMRRQERVQRHLRRRAARRVTGAAAVDLSARSAPLGWPGGR